MRPRIKRSVALVARSDDDSVLQRNQKIIDRLGSVDNKPCAIIYGKKYPIGWDEIDFYEENGFTVIRPKKNI